MRCGPRRSGAAQLAGPATRRDAVLLPTAAPGGSAAPVAYASTTDPPPGTADSWLRNWTSDLCDEVGQVLFSAGEREVARRVLMPADVVLSAEAVSNTAAHFDRDGPVSPTVP